jgi:hypothetical protein
VTGAYRKLMVGYRDDEHGEDALDGTARGDVSISGAELQRPQGFVLLLARRIATRWGLDDGLLWFEVEDH